MSIAYIGIGTNIGDREKNIREAVEALNHLPGTYTEKMSEIYETPPWGYTEQQEFYNVCVKVSTDLSPSALLGACLGIESAFGRERPFKNSPRILDMDLLLYDDIKINTPELTLPHPRMGERGFVLVPLKDILPEMRVGKINYNDDYKACDKTGIKKISSDNRIVVICKNSAE